MTKSRAEKKVQIAIDKMVDLQDGGYENSNGYVQEKVTRMLDALRELESAITGD